MADQTDINRFMELIALAHNEPLNKGDMAYIEVPRYIVEHFNRGKMQGFDSAGYFVYQGVRVYEIGGREESLRKEKLTMEQKVFQQKLA